MFREEPRGPSYLVSLAARRCSRVCAGRIATLNTRNRLCGDDEPEKNESSLLAMGDRLARPTNRSPSKGNRCHLSRYQGNGGASVRHLTWLFEAYRAAVARVFWAALDGGNGAIGILTTRISIPFPSVSPWKEQPSCSLDTNTAKQTVVSSRLATASFA